ncbi:MAG: sensor histidine kinase [Faecousia sp.]
MQMSGGHLPSPVQKLAASIIFRKAGNAVGPCCLSQGKIRDEGIGIRPEHISHIFDKFYQEDTAHASAGNGLGLSLVHRILELSGGEIQVENQEGQGTTFCIRLPSSAVK